MTSHVHHVTVDCADAYKLGTFWAEVLGASLADDDFPGDPEALVETPGAALLFITVPEPKSVKNRIHLDIQPEDRTRDEEVERLLDLGATLVADHRRPNGRGWATLADPEGNEFCVECSARERARLTGKRLPVTADDVTSAVSLAVDTLAGSCGRGLAHSRGHAHLGLLGDRGAPERRPLRVRRPARPAQALVGDRGSLSLGSGA